MDGESLVVPMQSIVVPFNNKVGTQCYLLVGVRRAGADGCIPLPCASSRGRLWSRCFLCKMFIYKYILLSGSWVRGGPGCLGIWVRDINFLHLGIYRSGGTHMPRRLGPGGTQLPRHMGPPGPKMGGGDPYACDTGSTRSALHGNSGMPAPTALASGNHPATTCGSCRSRATPTHPYPRNGNQS